MNFASLPSYCTMTYQLLDLSPTSANRQTPLKYRTTQTAPSYAGTMTSPVTWQSHTENAARFNNWWRAQIWAGLLRPRPYVHWVYHNANAAILFIRCINFCMVLLSWAPVGMTIELLIIRNKSVFHCPSLIPTTLVPNLPTSSLYWLHERFGD